MGQAAAQHGLMVKALSAERLVIEQDEVIGVEAGGETFRAGGVVIAGGAWSRDFGAQLGVQIPVEPQRGQIIHLDLPGVDTAGWPIINAFHGHYLVAWDDQRVAAGATREVDSGFEVKTTADGVREVLAEAIRVAPGLSKAGIREIRIGLRPATPDALPVLGSIPAVRRIYLATGHGPTGLQLGPYSGKLIAEMVLGNSIETDLSPFSVTRFQ
jgi:D-amino-acid dehydrogenase